MKIKSNKSLHHNSQTNHKPASEAEHRNNNQDSQGPQINLPSQLMLYRQLVQQLGLQSKEERIRFRVNFKEKYQKHLKMLEINHSNADRFRQGRDKQVIEEHYKIEERREQIQMKQYQAQDRKIKIKNKNIQKTQFEHEKWKSVVDKNKNQYLRNIKNSMKLIKRWENKLSTSLTKKNQILQKITEQTRQHNQYVNIVVERNKNVQSLQAQYKILKLQQSLSMRQKTGKKKTEQSENGYLNPERGYKTPQKHQKRSSSKTQRVKTYGSEAQVSVKTPEKLSRHRIHAANSQFAMHDESKSNLSKSSSYDHLNLKQAIDMENIEQSLCKNIEKEKRIAEARHVKSYLYQQRNKNNREKQQMTKLKIMENLQKLKEQKIEKNRKLDQKFNESRVRANTKNISSKRSSKLMDYESPNVSLPFINNKTDISSLVIPEYASLNLKNKKQNLPGIGYKAKISKNYMSQKKDSGHDDFIYLTETRQNSPRRQDDISSKYNKKIMQKLRSLSLIANIKERQQYNRNNQIFERAVQTKKTSKGIRESHATPKGGILEHKKKEQA